MRSAGRLTADRLSRPARTRRLPLDGCRVVDCTAWWAGPSATNVLAALGADVIKVESVGRPDQMRLTSVRRPPADHWWEWGPIFHAVNTGKRGVTIDLAAKDGIDLLRRLLRSADVFVENYTPRVMEQFGLDLGLRPRAQPGAHHGAHAGVRTGRPVAGPYGIRPDHGIGQRYGVADRIRPMAHRCSCAEPAIRSPACTPCSPPSWLSSNVIAPAGECGWSPSWSRPR